MRASCWCRLIALCGALGLPPASAGAQQWAGREDCRVAVPDGWRVSHVTWSGACQAGKASGRGVLRGLAKGQEPRLYFGILNQGQLDMGVIEVEGGYIAGRFEHGRAAPDMARTELIRAFDNASAAAREFAGSLKKAGNAKSADLYLRKAQELQEQMD